MSLSDKQFAAMHQQLKENGGFSANSRTGAAPEVGYMVSIPGYEKQIRSQNFAPGHIKEFVEKHGEQLKGDDRYVGGWDNAGEVSMDVSQNIRPNPEVARQYGGAVADADARTSADDLLVSRNQESGYDVRRDDVFFNAHFDSTRRQDPAV